MRLQVSFDESRFKAIEQLLDGIPGAFRTVAVSVINRGADHGRTLIKRAIKEELNLKQSDVLECIKISGAKPDRLGATIAVKRRPVKLIKFGNPTQSAAGVNVLVRRSHGAEEIPGAFIATMKSGHRGVFRRMPGKVAPTQGSYAGRTIKSGPRAGQPLLRQPIRELYGPTVCGVLAGKDGLRDAITKAIGDMVAKRMEAGVSRFLADPRSGSD